MVCGLHGCSARFSGWAAKSELSPGIGGAADRLSFAAASVLSGIAGWEGNCEFDCAEGGLNLECGTLATAFAPLRWARDRADCYRRTMRGDWRYFDYTRWRG